MKAKSPAKKVIVKGPELEKIVLRTMREISNIIGVTIGPGGNPVMVERVESGLPSSITKDGVTVFKSLGYADPAAHAIMEAARDASARTASEAGDGTSTTQILSESIVRKMYAFCNANPKMSPQKIVRHLERMFKDTIEPTIKALSSNIDSTTVEGQEILRNVARISANGDSDLASAVMECFSITGDQGNVTITESSGPSSYEVESVDGYPIPMGYEESCAKFYTKFINDPGTQQVILEKPRFLVYHGVITSIQSLLHILEAAGFAFGEWVEGKREDKIQNIVVVAVGFSETVLATLAANFVIPDNLNVFPLVAPKSPQMNGQLYYLEDVCAMTGASLFDQISKPLETATLEDLGPGVESFECQRYRSTILGFADETLLQDKISEVEKQLENPESILDKILLEERMAKLSGGIARLRVVGASSGELKEKRDRAEDAVCAVRGAIKFGCLPGGGWTLLKLATVLAETYPEDPVVMSILGPALMEPFLRILFNCGLSEDEVKTIKQPVLDGIDQGDFITYDAAEHHHVNAFEAGLLDSTPAVLEALRNSLSIASLLGTLGGIVVYHRDEAFERADAEDTAEFLRYANSQNSQ